MEQKGLLNWHWSVSSANNERFGHSQLGAHFPHPGFSGKTLTKHLQLHSPFPDDNRFKNSIERALGPRDLSGAQTLCVHETTEVIVVRKDKDLMLRVF